MKHILCYCPVYNGIREHFKPNYIANSEKINKEIIEKLIVNPQSKELFQLHKYLKQTLLLRYSLI